MPPNQRIHRDAKTLPRMLGTLDERFTMEIKNSAEPCVGPGYYKRGSIEVWDFIRDQGLNYHLGNAVKYICRAGFKDDREADLKKAIHYLTNELEHIEPTTTSQSFSYRFPGEEQYNAGFTG